MASILLKKASLLALLVILSCLAQAQEIKMKIRITINEKKVLTSTMTNSETARDFLALLPLEVTMSDLFTVVQNNFGLTFWTR